MRNMALLICVLLLFLFPLRNINALPQPPNPGFPVSTRYPPVDFKQWFKNLWGPTNQRLDGETLTVWLNQKSGSGFTSKHAYWAGYLSVEMKLQQGYTAGVDTSIYLSSTRDYAHEHDELDFEFLGNVEGKPYVLQTNVLTKQSTEADGYAQGREQQFNLWFDPTADFHRYAILWNPKEVIFFVDDVPIRRYRNKAGYSFLTKPMWCFGSIWDASSWATDNGLYKTNYAYQPFFAEYRNIAIHGSPSPSAAMTRRFTASPDSSFGLSPQQMSAMRWVRNNYMIYNYCRDKTRNPLDSSECRRL